MAENTLETQDNRRHLPRGPADEFAYRRFGGPTTRRAGTVTVGTSSQRILENNPNRVAYQLVNNGGAEVTVAFEAEISAGVGVILGASGGGLSRAIEEDGNAVGDPVYGISTSAGQTVWYEEIYVVKPVANLRP